jgi:uncharacterized membrane protein YfcA
MTLLQIHEWLALIGLGGGLIAGLSGLAGGIFIVLALVALYGTAGMGDAIAVSYFAVLFNSLSTSRANLNVVGPERFGAQVGAARWYVGGVVVASGLVAALFGRHPDALSTQSLAALQLLLAAGMLVPRQWYARKTLAHRKARDALVGALAGGMSTLISVGGGVYTIIYFMLHGRDVKDCTLIANFVGIFVGLMSVGGFYGYLAFAGGSSGSPAGGAIDATGKVILVVAGVLAAPIGVRLQRRAPAALIKRLMALFLGLSSCHVLFGA